MPVAGAACVCGCVWLCVCMCVYVCVRVCVYVCVCVGSAAINVIVSLSLAQAREVAASRNGSAEQRHPLLRRVFRQVARLVEALPSGGDDDAPTAGGLPAVNERIQRCVQLLGDYLRRSASAVGSMCHGERCGDHASEWLDHDSHGDHSLSSASNVATTPTAASTMPPGVPSKLLRSDSRLSSSGQSEGSRPGAAAAADANFSDLDVDIVVYARSDLEPPPAAAAASCRPG